MCSIQEHPHCRNYKGPGNARFLTSIEIEEARDANPANDRGYERRHSEAHQVHYFQIRRRSRRLRSSSESMLEPADPKVNAEHANRPSHHPTFLSSRAPIQVRLVARRTE